MQKRLGVLALLVSLALPLAAAAGPEHPGWDRAAADLRTNWQNKHPDAPITLIQRVPWPRFRSEKDWFEITYVFELTVKKASGERILRASANYRSKNSAPFVFTSLDEDVSEPGERTSPPSPLPLIDPKDSRLLRAVRAGDHASVSAALAAGSKVETKDEEGQHALLLAAALGNTAIVKTLLDKGADVNATTASGMTALMLSENPRIAQLLLEKGARVNAKDKHGQTALMKAKSPAVAKLLLDKGASLDARDDDKATAFITASERGYADVVKVLIAKGADVAARNSSGVTALMLAANGGRAEIVELLLHAGAEVNAKEPHGMTPLLAAVTRGHAKVVQLLLDKGANPNARDELGLTVLMKAAERGSADIVRLLVDKGADVSAKDTKGRTAANVAAESGQWDIGKLIDKLVEKPAKSGLDAATCADPCALLTLYAYDDLVANACKLCKRHDDRFCEMGFPFNDVPACDAYDELRNCVYARFGYVFSKPKWQKQFGSLPWYKPDPGFTEAKLPPVAKANVQKLKALKAKKQGCE